MKNIKIILTLAIIVVFPIRIHAHPMEYFILYNSPLVFFAFLLSGMTKYIILKSKYPIKNKLVKKIVFIGCLEIFCTVLAIFFSGLPILLLDGKFSFPILIFSYFFLGGFVNQYLLFGTEMKLAPAKKYLLSIVLAMPYLIFIGIIYTVFSVFKNVHG